MDSASLGSYFFSHCLLYKYFKDDFSLVLKGDYNVNNLIGKIVETRNYLVHRGDKKDVLEINQMPAIAKVLENIVKLNIFRLIGVNENKIHNKIKQINYDDIFPPHARARNVIQRS